MATAILIDGGTVKAGNMIGQLRRKPWRKDMRQPLNDSIGQQFQKEMAETPRL
jgi:hypothetical protein